MTPDKKTLITLLFSSLPLFLSSASLPFVWLVIVDMLYVTRLFWVSGGVLESRIRDKNRKDIDKNKGKRINRKDAENRQRRTRMDRKDARVQERKETQFPLFFLSLLAFFLFWPFLPYMEYQNPTNAFHGSIELLLETILLVSLHPKSLVVFAPACQAKKKPTEPKSVHKC